MTPEDTTIQVLIVWALGLSTLINFGTVIWNIFSGPSKRNALRLDEHNARLDRHEHRLSAIEQRSQDQPSRQDFHKMEITMMELSSAMAVLTERLKPLEAITERAQEWMLEHNRK